MRKKTKFLKLIQQIIFFNLIVLSGFGYAEEPAPLNEKELQLIIERESQSITIMLANDQQVDYEKNFLYGAIVKSPNNCPVDLKKKPKPLDPKQLLKTDEYLCLFLVTQKLPKEFDIYEQSFPAEGKRGPPDIDDRPLPPQKPCVLKESNSNKGRKSCVISASDLMAK